MMSRRTCFAVIAMMAAAMLYETPQAQAAIGRTMNVQVRVYRQPRPGDFRFISNVPVQLSNGMTGTTTNANGMAGTCFFRNVPQANYSARANVGGRWYGATGYQWFGTTLRINIQIP